MVIMRGSKTDIERNRIHLTETTYHYSCCTFHWSYTFLLWRSIKLPEWICTRSRCWSAPFVYFTPLWWEEDRNAVSTSSFYLSCSNQDKNIFESKILSRIIFHKKLISLPRFLSPRIIFHEWKMNFKYNRSTFYF